MRNYHVASAFCATAALAFVVGCSGSDEQRPDGTGGTGATSGDSGGAGNSTGSGGNNSTTGGAGDNPGAGGASTGGGGSGVTVVGPAKSCPGGMEVTDFVIDDFEDDDPAKPTISVYGTGTWKVPKTWDQSDDGALASVASRQDSAGNAMLLTANQVENNDKALLQVGWPLDASDSAGVAFDARVAGGSLAEVTMRLGDHNTFSALGVCVDPNCNDDFQTSRTLTTEWTTYLIGFDELAQSGFGNPKPSSIDTARLYTMIFEVATGGAVAEGDEATGDLELWIDNIRLTDCAQ